MRFNPNVPTGLVDLDQDYINLRNNFSVSNTAFGVNHTPFSVADNQGFHTKIDMNNQDSPIRLGDLTLYARSAGGVAALWAKNSTQDFPLFSGPVSGGTNGYSSMFGGIILQWGIVNGMVATNPVLFTTSNINFPINCFTVQATLIPTTPPTTNAQTISITSVSRFGFTANYSGGSAYNAFYWFAIGN